MCVAVAQEQLKRELMEQRSMWRAAETRLEVAQDQLSNQDAKKEVTGVLLCCGAACAFELVFRVLRGSEAREGTAAGGRMR